MASNNEKAVLSKRHDEDCLACRLVSGIGVIGIGAYSFTMANSQKTKFNKNAMILLSFGRISKQFSIFRNLFSFSLRRQYFPMAISSAETRAMQATPRPRPWATQGPIKIRTHRSKRSILLLKSRAHAHCSMWVWTRVEILHQLWKFSIFQFAGIQADVEGHEQSFPTIFGCEAARGASSNCHGSRQSIACAAES